MVEGLIHPLNIFLLGLGGGFLIPLLYRLSKRLPAVAFWVALGSIAALSAICFWRVLERGGGIEIETAGSLPPMAISLRFGVAEGYFAFLVNLVAVLGAWQLWSALRESYTTLLLYLILVMGINGMIMTRDLFNLFVFLEIVSVGTYGLFGLGRSASALAASFKYIMATVLASSLFLLGAALAYHVSGTLSIDEMIARRELFDGPLGATALILVLACLVIELKPYPANGWGLDVYETAPAGIAAIVSVGVSAGVFFALLKLLPLFEAHLTLIALSAAITFLAANLIGLRQGNVQRMLGCSSVAQMALLTMALALLSRSGEAELHVAFVIGGLFANHLFAKAGLFWLAGALSRERIRDWNVLSTGAPFVMVFAALLVAIAGLPPFPGFWAKWELVMRLAANGDQVWIAVVLLGSLLEAAYLFRWFCRAVGATRGADAAVSALTRWHRGLIPSAASVLLLLTGGVVAAGEVGAASAWLFAPLLSGAILLACEGLAGRLKCVLVLLLVSAVGFWLLQGVGGISGLFGALFLAGGVVIASAGLYRDDARHGYYPLMAVLLLSMIALLRAPTSLEFFFCWEMVTLASCFLLALSPSARRYVLQFFLFSLAAAFLLLAGFGLAAAILGTTSLSAYAAAGPAAAPAFVLLAMGCLVKIGVIGVHVWLPNAHATADGDLSAIFSPLVTKVPAFGLFMAAYLATRSQVGLELAHVVGWIGMLTAAGAALLALNEPDIKRMLAYSSLSQTGYIVAAISLMSHLGWVTALYLVANHMMVKGILFLTATAVIHRTGLRRLEDGGGLARRMPLTFIVSVAALVSMSGLPPLAGFGGKWLLLTAMLQKEWYGPLALGAVATLIGLLYMFRFGHALFLGPLKRALSDAREAPATLLVPQFLLLAGILLLSFFPKPFMVPVSAAIDPQFASTLVWQGMSLELIYAYWDPTRAIVIAVVIAAIGWLALWLIYRGGRRPGQVPGVARFYQFYRVMLAPLQKASVERFWGGVAIAVERGAGAARRVYTGDGQTYALQVLYYVIALYFVAIELPKW